MKYTMIRKALSLLLVLCFVLGMIPSFGIAAKAVEAEQSPELTALAGNDPIDNTADLQAAIDNVPEGGGATFVVKSFAVESPISITKGKRIKILGASKGSTRLSADLTAKWKTMNGLFEMTNGTSLFLENLTVDGEGLARCIYM